MENQRKRGALPCFNQSRFCYRVWYKACQHGSDEQNCHTIAGLILAAEIDAAANRYEQAIAQLERAVLLQDGLMYNEPPDWYFPVRHYLGAVLLEAGHPQEAETVYWHDLSRNRENGYSLLGLQKALEAKDRKGEAAALAERQRKAFAQADVVLTTSRY